MKQCIKRHILPIGAVAWLALCWFIGQATHGHGKVMDANVDETNGDTWSVTYEGSKQTDDNPWGITAGTIKWEGEDYIFLTPNTSAILSNLPTSGEIELAYRIHPWVSEGSDGAGLVVTVMDETGTDIASEERMIKVDDISETWNLNMGAYPKGTGIKVLCNNGEYGDDRADWVIVQINAR